MCQPIAYILKEGKEKQLLADVATIIPQGRKLRLISLFGEEAVVEASIEEINLLGHKILLKPE